MGALFRIQPAMPVGAYKTYQILSPVTTHFRPATCEEAGCGPYLRGWLTRVDESTDLGQGQAHYIRHDRTRRHTEHRDDGGLTVFTFGPGQRCFAADQHKVPLGRPEIFRRRGGDWRGNPTGETYTHTRPEHWVEDFAEHQQSLADRQARG